MRPRSWTDEIAGIVRLRGCWMAQATALDVIPWCTRLGCVGSSLRATCVLRELVVCHRPCLSAAVGLESDDRMAIVDIAALVNSCCSVCSLQAALGDEEKVATHRNPTGRWDDDA